MKDLDERSGSTGPPAGSRADSPGDVLPPDSMLPPPPPSAADVLVSRVAWFVQLRWLAVVGVFAAVAVARPVLGVDVPQGPLCLLAGLLLVSNACFFRWAQRLRAIEEEARRARQARVFANTQISSDLILLTLLLHFSGGVENPFSLFFVFHMVLASVLLSARASYLQATLAVALFGSMALIEFVQPQFHVHLDGFLQEDVCQNSLFALSRVLVLGSTLFIAVFLTSTIAGRLRRTEAQLREASGQMEQLVWRLTEGNLRLLELEERKSRFMRVAAHQLRSPLAAIDSCLKLVLDGYLAKDHERELDMVSRAHTRAESMLGLIGELLDLAHHREAEPEDLKVEPAEMDPVIEAVAQLHAATASEKGVALDCDAGLEDARVTATEEQIRDVVANLISNAIKYTPPAGRVAVRTWRENDQAWFEVKDTGIGIPDEEQKQLFHEFFRASNARAHETQGTGLGLIIAREIVKKHGGDVEFESKVGEGTTFRFHLPLATATS